MTILYLILRILSNPFANAFQKKIVQKDSAILSNFYVYLLLATGCLIPFCKEVTGITPEVYGYASFAGILCTMGTICLIKALERGELSVLGPINSYKCIIGLISAYIFLGEVPGWWGIIGMVLIIYGSRFIFETTKEGFSLELLKRRDIQLRFAALFFSGVEAGILKKVISLSSPEISFYLWCIFGAVFTFIVLIMSKERIKRPENIRDYIVVGVSLAIMQLSTNKVFAGMDVGLALALFQLSTLVTLLLGYKMFKEREIKKKLVGSLIMIIGSAIILIQ